MIILRFYRYGRLYEEEADSVEEAMLQAFYQLEDGQAAPQEIVAGEKVYDRKEIDAFGDRYLAFLEGKGPRPSV